MKHIQYNGELMTLVRERDGVAELFDRQCNIHTVEQSKLDYSTLQRIDKPLVPGRLLLPDRPSDWLTKWREERLRIVAANIKTRKVEKSLTGEPKTPGKRKPKASSDEQLMAKMAEMMRKKMLGGATAS